jgi:hypothetical protein
MKRCLVTDAERMRQTVGVNVDCLINGFIDCVAQKETARLGLDTDKPSVIARFETFTKTLFVDLLRPFRNLFCLFRQHANLTCCVAPSLFNFTFLVVSGHNEATNKSLSRGGWIR